MEKINLRNAAEALKEKQAVEVLTSGRSMEPMLKEHRDIAVISRPIAPFEKGDIVLYLRGENKCVLHRIVKIKDEELVIRGDNNLFYERDIKKEDILGILTAVYRNGKYMSRESAEFKRFGLINQIRFPFIFIYRKIKYLLWKILKAKK